MIVAGLLCVVGDLSLGWVILAGALGAFAGDNISYALGRFVGRPAQERFLNGERSQRALAWARGQLAKRGGLVVILGRYVPGGRTAVTFTAGLTHYSYPRFAGYDVIAAVTWATYAALLGYFGGRVLRAPRLGSSTRRVRDRSLRHPGSRGHQAAALMNRLADETSPYLLQHKDNPVDWYPWGDEALARARDEDRPIMLSIGYAACHWCHVMERESFEDELTARVLNEHFISIKVDREERPDLDSIYMDAVVALIGSGGWPMTVFLTPAGEPFFGGTYFPPEPRHGLPSFKQVLLGVAEAWRDQRSEVDRSGRNLAEHIRSSAQLMPSNEPLTGSLLADAQRALGESFDPQWGGWGRAPKFPPAPVLEFLLRRGEEEMTRRTLDGMALGGMYDLVGGGFHRYSVDERWLVPHFEKMLYDNALLASVYLHAARRFDEPRYRRIADATLDYLQRELALDGGGFGSAQDADTEGVEGLTFSWAPGEGAPEELLQPFEHGRFVLRGEPTSPRAPGSMTCASSVRSPRGTTRRSRRGTASCSPRSPRADGSNRQRRSRGFCSAHSPSATAACTARGVAASPREPATWRTTPTSPTA